MDLLILFIAWLVTMAAIFIGGFFAMYGLAWLVYKIVEWIGVIW